MSVSDVGEDERFPMQIHRLEPCSVCGLYLCQHMVAPVDACPICQRHGGEHDTACTAYASRVPPNRPRYADVGDRLRMVNELPRGAQALYENDPRMVTAAEAARGREETVRRLMEQEGMTAVQAEARIDELVGELASSVRGAGLHERYVHEGRPRSGTSLTGDMAEGMGCDRRPPEIRVDEAVAALSPERRRELIEVMSRWGRAGNRPMNAEQVLEAIDELENMGCDLPDYHRLPGEGIPVRQETPGGQRRMRAGWRYEEEDDDEGMGCDRDDEEFDRILERSPMEAVRRQRELYDSIAERQVSQVSSPEYEAGEESVLIVDAGSNPVTVTLPTAEPGRELRIRRRDDSDNPVTIVTPGRLTHTLESSASWVFVWNRHGGVDVIH